MQSQSLQYLHRTVNIVRTISERPFAAGIQFQLFISIVSVHIDVIHCIKCASIQGISRRNEENRGRREVEEKK